ncbi:uncharacterized protein EV154DRAFT_436999, partial [Mucor mucedo]|uniref:uncharacterized protein n=1 Tax=Mucor mucedo TaxID=29922 RepID=UPI00222053A0
MIEVGETPEAVDAVIVEEKAKLQVVLDKSKKELPVSETKDTTTETTDSIAFYDKLQVSIETQVEEVKKTVKDSYAPESEVTKIDVHTVKEDFKKAVEVELVEAKTVVYKDAGVSESEVTVIATKPIEHVKHETVNVCKPTKPTTKDITVVVTKPVTKDTTVIVTKPVESVTVVEEVKKHADVIIVEDVKKQTDVVVEEKLSTEVIETVEHIEVVTDKTKTWFGKLVEKVNGMIEVGETPEAVDAVIVEEKAKLQIVLDKSKKELPVSETKDTTTETTDSIAFYDKLQVSIETQVEEVKKTVKDSYAPESEVTKIDVHTVKEDFKKAVEVELVEAKTVVYKDAGVSESEVTVIATKPIEHVKHETVNVCKPTKPVTKDTTVIVTKPVEGVTVVEEVKKHADVIIVEDVKKQTDVVVEEKLSTEVIETVEHIEVVTDKTNTWFGDLVEKVNGMIEVGETPEAVDAVIVEEKAKLQVVLDKSKKELPVSETKDTTTETTDSIAFYDKLQVSIETQVEEVKKTVKDSYAPESEVTKIDVHTVKEDFKKAVEVELVEAKTVVYKDAGVTESEVTVIATKPIEHVKHETVNVCKPTKPTTKDTTVIVTKPVTKDTTVIVAKPVEGVTVVEEVEKHADVIIVEDVKKQTDVVVEEKLSTEVIETVEHIEVVTDKTNTWFGKLVEKVNGMIEVGETPEAVDAVIVEEKAKLQVVLDKSKKELPVSETKDTTTETTDSIAFYDKLQVSIETQVEEVKKTVKDSYAPESEVTKIDVHTVKEDFKKAVEVELVEAKTVVYKDAGVTESEVTVIATKPIEHVKHETVNVCKPTKPTTKDTTVIVTKPVEGVTVVEEVKKHADVIIVEDVKKQTDVVVEEKLSTEVIETVEHIEVVTDKTNTWFGKLVEKVNGMIEVGETPEAVDAVIVEEKAKLQVVLDKSKKELPVSETKDTTTETTDSIAFYDKLQVSIETQVEEVKKTVKDSYAPESEVTKIDVHTVKEDFKKAVEVELVEAKTVVFKDAGVSESEVTVIATKPIEHVKHETVNVCKPTKPTTKDTTVIVTKPVEGVTVVEEVKKHADVIIVEDVKKQTDVVVEEKLSTEVIETVEHIEVVTDKTNTWFGKLVEKVNGMIEVGETPEAVDAVIVEEKAKLQVVLDKSKKELPVSETKDTTTETTDSIAFYDKLQVSIETQVEEVKKTVKDSYAPESEVTKIDVHTVKEDFKKAVEVELVEAKTVVFKDAGVTESEVTVIATKPIEHVKHETVNVCKPTKPVTKDTTVIVAKPVEGVTVVEEVEKHADVIIVEDVKKQTDVVVEEKLSTEVIETVEHIEVVTDKTNTWFGDLVEKVNGMIEVGETPEAVDAVIVEEKAKLQVVLDKSKKELPVSETKDTTTETTDSIAFYDKLQVSIETQVEEVKKTVKDSYAPESEVTKIDVHTVKEDFKKAVEVELVEAKTVVYKDAGVTESEVTVIATKPIEHVKHETVNVCKPTKPTTKDTTVVVTKPVTKDTTVIVAKPVEGVTVVEEVKKQADVIIVEDVKKETDVVVEEKLSTEVIETVEHIEVVTDKTNTWFGDLVEKVNGMIEVGETPEAVDAVIVEEKAKLQVVLDKSKKELPVSETKDTTTETTDSIAFYDKLQVSIETQVEEVKKTVKDSYAPESEVTKIDVHTVKEDFKKAVEVELVEAKTVVYKDAGVSESEVTVIATKPIEHVKHETVNVCKPTKPVTKDTTVIVAKPVE